MPTEFTAFSLELVDIINKSGYEARFVGGCVRDSLIGKNFADIDIATNMLPKAIENLLKKQNIKTFPTGIEHGTITAVKNHENVEITTLRKDIECDGRRAKIEFTDDWYEDAARRDFTFNALYIDARGNLYDYFNGVDDLNNGIVKFINNAEERIQEDYLRILRFFRFNAHYSSNTDYMMDGEVLSIISENIDGMKNVSVERIRAEFFKLIMSEISPDILSMMEKCKILQKILPIQEYKIYNLFNLLELNNKVNYITRLSCLIKSDNHSKDHSYNNIEIATNYLVLSRTEKKCLQDILYPKYIANFDLSQEEQKKSIRTLGKENYKNILLLQASESEIFNSGNVEDKLNNLFDFADNWLVPKLPLRGIDFLKIGYKEGREIGDMLKNAEIYWEAHDYKTTKSELLEFLDIRDIKNS